ncbi:MAG: PD40 domain-containing protein [Gammaproteobacteria bacterium]|nr:PD40 domain-containing protein [Gammaproteobacteria bacterium]
MSVYGDKTRSFRLGDCLVDRAGHCLRFDGGVVCALQPKFIEVLACLARAGGAVVPRESLIAEVWDGNGYVGEKALTNAVWHLRKALSQGQETGEAIETVHKGGYALRLPVVWLDEAAEEAIEAPGRRAWPWKAGLAALVPVLAGLSWLGWQAPAPETPRSRSLTSEPGRELYPQPTPDGRQFAYLAVDVQGRRDLFLRDRLAPERPARRLTDDVESEGPPAFSPDGQYLYYARREAGGRCVLRRLELVSGQARSLGACGDGGPAHLAVFPDGKTLAFEDGEGQVSLMALEQPGFPVRPLRCVGCAGEVQHLAVSPEGGRLALSRRLGDLREDVFVLELASGRQRRLTTGHVLIRGLTWLPDGQRILFSAENAKRQEAHLVLVADGHDEALGVNGFAAPALVPGTETVLYHDFALRQYVGSLPLDEVAAVLPSALIQSGSSHHAPHYSPAAGRIAYVSNESGFDEIWSAAADGSGRERLTNLRSKALHPRWSPDGRSIAFRGQGEQSEGDALYVLDVASKAWRRVPSPFRWHKRPSWTPDGQGLVVAARGEGAGGLYRLSLDGGTAPRLLAPSARMGVLLDSGALVYTRTDAPGLWRLAVPGGMPERILPPEVFGTAYNWDADGAGLCFEYREAGYHHVRCQAWGDARARTLLKAPLGTLADTGSMALMRAQGRLLLTMDEYPQADIRELMLPE